MQIAKTKMITHSKLPRVVDEHQRKKRSQKDAVGGCAPQESLLKYRKLGHIWYQLARTSGKLWRSMSASGSAWQ